MDRGQWKGVDNCSKEFNYKQMLMTFLESNKRTKGWKDHQIESHMVHSQPMYMAILYSAKECDYSWPTHGKRPGVSSHCFARQSHQVVGALHPLDSTVHTVGTRIVLDKNIKHTLRVSACLPGSVSPPPLNLLAGARGSWCWRQHKKRRGYVRSGKTMWTFLQYRNVTL